MLRFRRNKSIAIRQTVLLFLYLLAMLYYCGELVHANGLYLFLGIMVIFLWTIVIVLWDFRFLLHCLDWIELRSEGICVKHIHKEKIYFWSQINEAELRRRVAMEGVRSHPVQVVMSNVVLSNTIRKWICSDVNPWIFKEMLVEFDLGGQEKESDICLQLSQRSELFFAAIGDSDIKGISISTKSISHQLDYFNLLVFSKGSSLFSSLRFAEAFLWFLAIIATNKCLSQQIIRIDNFTKYLWILCLVLSSIRFVWIICIKARIKANEFLE